MSPLRARPRPHSRALEDARLHPVHVAHGWLSDDGVVVGRGDYARGGGGSGGVSTEGGAVGCDATITSDTGAGGSGMSAATASAAGAHGAMSRHPPGDQGNRQGF